MEARSAPLRMSFSQQEIIKKKTCATGNYEDGDKSQGEIH